LLGKNKKKESCHCQWNLRAAATRNQDISPQGKTRAPLSQMECNIPDETQIVGINNSPVLKTDTGDTKVLTR
jgi:hypothetical protein